MQYLLTSDFIYELLVLLANTITVAGIMSTYLKTKNIKPKLKIYFIALIFVMISYTFIFDILLKPLVENLNQDSYTDILISWLYANLSNYSMIVLSIHLFLDKNLKLNLFITSIFWSMYGLLFFCFNNFLYLFTSPEMLLYPMLGIIMAIVIFIIQYSSVKFLRFKELFEEFNNRNYPYWFVISVSILVLMIVVWVPAVIPRYDSEFRIEELFTLVVILSLLVLLVRYSYNLIRIKTEYEYNQMILNQQNLYIKDLEDIQQNMRIFKHDYKNMMSSIYLNSKEGNLKEIENLISDMIDEFDENIDSKMSLTTQLSNIQINEVKSLLFKKITEIHKRNIDFHLEVVKPVQKNNIQTVDLVRMLGILLDNAIEEVEENHGDITLLMIQDEDALTIVVDNYVNRDVNINEIDGNGFSTKENHLGIGLHSLENIINKYSNISHNISCKNNRVVQEIIILMVRR